MTIEPHCSSRRCKHFRGAVQSTPGDETTERLVCAAYPDGIPDAIAYGTDPHTNPRPGDHGVTYERDPAAE